MPEVLDLLKALSDNSVDFVIVGEYAMILHGLDFVVTMDLDLAVAIDAENGTRLIRALAEFEPFPPQFGSAKNFVWDERSLQVRVMSLVTTAGNIDILRTLPGVESYEALEKRSIVIAFAEEEYRIASVDDLIAMKMAAGRPKDLEHIQHLKALKPEA